MRNSSTLERDVHNHVRCTMMPEPGEDGADQVRDVRIIAVTGARQPMAQGIAARPGLSRRRFRARAPLGVRSIDFDLSV